MLFAQLDPCAGAAVLATEELGVGKPRRRQGGAECQTGVLGRELGGLTDRPPVGSAGQSQGPGLVLTLCIALP